MSKSLEVKPWVLSVVRAMDVFTQGESATLGFDRATLFRAWKLLSFVALSRMNSRFNGATLFRAWKLPPPGVLWHKAWRDSLRTVAHLFLLLLVTAGEELHNAFDFNMRAPPGVGDAMSALAFDDWVM